MMLCEANNRPGPVPWDPAKPLYESGLVGVGTVRMRSGHPEMNRDRVAYVWPTISLPRLPYAVSFDREESVQGDRNTATFTSVGAVMRRRGLTEQGVLNVWVDVHPGVLAGMLSAKHGGCQEPDARFPWRFAPLPTAPLLAVTQLVSRLRDERLGGSGGGGGGGGGGEKTGRDCGGVSPPALSGRGRSGAFALPTAAWCGDGGLEAPTPLEIEETLLGAIGDLVGAAADAWAPPRRRPPSVAQARFHREAIDEVRRIMAVASAQRHSLDELARAVHISPFHLCRLFKRMTGLPIHRYLERLRLRAVLEEAVENRTRMLDIALRQGFCSEAHLSNAFLREFGRRPSELRRSWRGGP